MHSPATILWDEWVSLPPEDGRAAESETAGIFAGLGLDDRQDVAQTTIFASRRLPLFRRLARLWPRTSWCMEHSFADVLRLPPERKGTLRLDLPISLLERITTRDSAKGDMRWHWMRGYWGAAGSLFLLRSGIYLALCVRDHERENSLLLLLEEVGGASGSRLRGGRRELLLRNQETIAVFFAQMGLARASLSLEERGLLRAMRDRANRLVNCDAANIRKSLEAAERHLALCRKIEEIHLLDSLPDDLRDLVEARLRNPSLSLSELGQVLARPVSKSTVEYRWAKLKKLIPESLVEEGGERVPRKI